MRRLTYGHIIGDGVEVPRQLGTFPLRVDYGLMLVAQDATCWRADGTLRTEWTTAYTPALVEDYGLPIGLIVEDMEDWRWEGIQPHIESDPTLPGVGVYVEWPDITTPPPTGALVDRIDATINHRLALAQSVGLTLPAGTSLRDRIRSVYEQMSAQQLGADGQVSRTHYGAKMDGVRTAEMPDELTVNGKLSRPAVNAAWSALLARGAAHPARTVHWMWETAFLWLLRREIG